MSVERNVNSLAGYSRALESSDMEPTRCVYNNGKECKLRADDKQRLVEAAKLGNDYHPKYHSNECCPLVLFPDLLAAKLIKCKDYKPRQKGEQFLF